MTETGDRRRARGQRSREAVLEHAVRLGSVDGLDGLSLGHLASATGISKSGLFAHWKDKEELQLDTVAWARQQWVDHIVRPAMARPNGVRRLFALHETRLRFYADRVLPGGCFFTAVYAELDDRPGPVRDRITEALEAWFDLLRRTVVAAVDDGELPTDVDPGRLALEVEALGAIVVTHTQLLSGLDVYAMSRRAVLERLRALSTEPTLLPKE
ncbi:TetR/AcrR family transcriptional regulator [Spiractinospora alimapuensis]|uniref:TetR/AcrR family transcriptional regulator n=1 Tax=Spiractinospora alimapuensis TaxID=2820884 RepID=UPI001F2AC80E|nr:TetR/AcrR family transcriptional regulator [Spiractinospora alimapuensis]QVQ50759.1 TetR/AcrR family transcriptional regulator [Spiractinospora alimapuensis]